MKEKVIKKECMCCMGTGSQYFVNGEWVREQREKAKISLRSAAKKIGISAAYLSDMELGRKRISQAVLTFVENL